MHADFNSTHPNHKCSYITYTRYVSAQNIAFVKLGEEECEVCIQLDKATHETEEGKCKVDCSICIKMEVHKENYTQARNEYFTEGSAVIQDKIVRSVDLQKVVMLPRMPGVKSVCFTRRIIAFHLTFAPVKQYLTSARTLSMVWHEALAGRKCEEITSLYVQALLKDRDYDKIVYFMDNCSSQNKNWSIISAMVNLINSGKLTASEITFKYLEAGHTFMSADVIHAGVEREMKKKKDVLDFEDFKRCVTSVGSVELIAPEVDSFRNFKGEQSAAKLAKRDRPLLGECKQMEFRKGSKSLFYKKEHKAAEFQEFDFMKARAKLGKFPPPLRSSARGIPGDKKLDIVNKLCPLMPENRRQFWFALDSEDVVDLLVEDD